jgi:hypothetical protein
MANSSDSFVVKMKIVLDEGQLQSTIAQSQAQQGGHAQPSGNSVATNQTVGNAPGQIGIGKIAAGDILGGAVMGSVASKFWNTPSKALEDSPLTNFKDFQKELRNNIKQAGRDFFGTTYPVTNVGYKITGSERSFSKTKKNMAQHMLSTVNDTLHGFQKDMMGDSSGGTSSGETSSGIKKSEGKLSKIFNSVGKHLSTAGFTGLGSLVSGLGGKLGIGEIAIAAALLLNATFNKLSEHFGKWNMNIAGSNLRREQSEIIRDIKVGKTLAPAMMAWNDVWMTINDAIGSTFQKIGEWDKDISKWLGIKSNGGDNSSAYDSKLAWEDTVSTNGQYSMPSSGTTIQQTINNNITNNIQKEEQVQRAIEQFRSLLNIANYTYNTQMNQVSQEVYGNFLVGNM